MEDFQPQMVQLRAVVKILYFFLPAYVANMSPVLIRPWLCSFAVPIDGGMRFRGRRLLGDHKTWRGLLAGMAAGTVVYELQRLAATSDIAGDLALMDYMAQPVYPGLLMGLGAGIGDAVKSFFKRRIDIAPGESWPIFDQLDFFVGAYLFVAPISAPPLVPTLLSLPIILLGNLASELTGYWLGFKQTWL